MNQEIEEACREAGIGASAGMETERRKPLKLMVRQDLEVLLTEEGRGAEEIMMSQSLFEHAVLYRREKRVLPEMRHVRILHLQAEEEKVSLFFLPGLARSLPALKLICVEGEGRYTLSVDRDARVSGYSFAVFSRKVEKVIQFYPQAQGGEFPLLILPETGPADVCRACRVQLMIPFLTLVSNAELSRNPTVKEEIESAGLRRPRKRGTGSFFISCWRAIRPCSDCPRRHAGIFPGIQGLKGWTIPRHRLRKHTSPDRNGMEASILLALSLDEC